MKMETINQQLKNLDESEKPYKTFKTISFSLKALGAVAIGGIIASPFLLFISVKYMLITLGASFLLMGIVNLFQKAFEYALVSNMLDYYPNIAKWDVSSSQEEDKIEMLRTIQKFIKKHENMLKEK